MPPQFSPTTMKHQKNGASAEFSDLSQSSFQATPAAVGGAAPATE